MACRAAAVAVASRALGSASSQAAWTICSGEQFGDGIAPLTGPGKICWTNPLRGTRVIETTFSDFTSAIADDPLPLA